MIAEAMVLRSAENRDKVSHTRTANLFGRMFECLHLLYAASWAVQLNLILKFRSSDWPDEEEPD